MKYNPQDGFPYYFELVAGQNLSQLYASSATFSLLKTIDEAKSEYRYHPEKWSIKQVLGHITDHERIKMSRAFLLSRKEQVELWGYDQEKLVANSRFEALTFQQLITDFKNVRNASMSFIASLSDEQLKLIGNARQYHISLHDFLLSIIGHEIHHITILRKHYLNLI